ncbi:hypothetical protein SLEP1_g13275 [Rubroshorea leprosula]|uniref:Uncharacterized protein n=1 Tax=Rubroshorea leprosula TaxID=152421 RepID=A0AAV5IRP6_9ROSI|nr:hypothetical protein SLEP1_g13275 [Rubroshorea leprosula]
MTDLNYDFSVNFCLFCLRYGHVIRVPASGRFINASTCRHVRDRTGSLVALLVGIIH